MCVLKKKNIPGLKLLLFRDGEEYVAHILDFDLVGTGSTKDEAVREVCEAALEQIAYALEHSCIDKIFKPAPLSCYKKWEEVGQHAIMNILISEKKKTLTRRSMPVYEAYELPAASLCPALA